MREIDKIEVQEAAYHVDIVVFFKDGCQISLESVKLEWTTDSQFFGKFASVEGKGEDDDNREVPVTWADGLRVLALFEEARELMRKKIKSNKIGGVR